MSSVLAGRRVLVWGFGRHGGGLAAARFCAARGATVAILDAKAPADLGPDAVEAAARGWIWHQGDGRHAALDHCDLIVASPAIPPRAWPAVHAPATSPEGLFCAAHRGQRVAVTGTKGKSTTARILGTLLGWEVAGNSYEPLLDVLERVGPAAPLVCELSSFQLYYLSGATGLVKEAPVQPDTMPGFSAAIITSLAVDHLDWHPDLDHYHRSKMGVLSQAQAWALAPEIHPRLDAGYLSQSRLVPAVYFNGQAFSDAAGILASREDVPLLGVHNARNAALAIATALHLGLERTQVATRLAAVRPLPHRLETVHAAAGLRFVNDSIATTPESALAGIASFTGPLAVILGGSDKGATWELLASTIARQAASQHLVPVVIGQTGRAIAAALAQVGIASQGAATLVDAVALAVAALPGGGTVLLSPACASFDMFQGFEERGRIFAELARKW